MNSYESAVMALAIWDVQEHLRPIVAVSRMGSVYKSVLIAVASGLVRHMTGSALSVL